jgi:type IV secretion system protein VirD4
MGHINASVDHIERPLMTPDEVQRIKPPKKQGEGNAERIVEPGDMLIFVSGHYPILGTQMLYFADPVLSLRAKIPPPERLWAIEEKGKVVPQAPMNRTRHELSKAETLDSDPTEEHVMPRMRQFIQETTGAIHANEPH